MSELLIRDARTLAGEEVDVLIEGNEITTVKQSNSLSRESAQTYDAAGRLLTPSLSEPHVHLDMALIAGSPEWNQSGTLSEGINRWKQYKSTLEGDDVRDRAERAIEWLVANGVTRVRTHVDTTEENLTALEVLLELKSELDGFVDLELVAFPQDGLLTEPHHEDLLREALEMGADVVGGIPHFEYTYLEGVQSVKVAVEFANKFDCPVDLHIDETDDPNSRFTEVLAREALRYQIGARTTASHTTAMHSYPNGYAERLISMLADSGVSVVTNPLDNAVLQGRYDDYPRRRGHTRIDELREAGVTVGLGHDSVMDPVYHYGCGDPLDAAFVLIHYAHMNGYDDVKSIWDMLVKGNAEIFGLGPDTCGIQPGAEGSLVVYDGRTPFDVLRTRAARRLVIKSGKVVATAEPAKSTVHRADGDTIVDFSRAN